MKIIYIDDPGDDYGAYMLYDGLCEVLGHENVIDWPAKPSFHTKTSGLLPWIKLTPDHSYTIRNVIDNIDSVDYIILASFKKIAVTWFKRLMEDVEKEKKHLPPIIMVDQGDSPKLDRADLIDCYAPMAVFKRELLIDTEFISAQLYYPRLMGHVKVYPLPYSISERLVCDDIQHHNRNIAISGYFTNNHLYRNMAQKHLLTYHADILIGDIPPLDYKEYIKRLRNSRVSVSIRGGGYDTLRFYEIIASGAALISSRHDIISPRPFINNEHLLYVDPNNSDYVNIITAFMQDQHRCEKMAKSAREHLLKYHTTRARAKWFIETIDGVV